MKKYLSLLVGALGLCLFVACSEDGSEEITPPLPPHEDDKEIVIENEEDKKVVFSEGKNSRSITFTAPQSWTAQISGTTDWASVKPTSGNAGKSTVTVSVEANETTDSREAELLIKSGQKRLAISIAQAHKNAIAIAQDRYVVEEQACQLEIEVKHNVNVMISTDADWISFKESRSMNKHTAIFSIAKNSSDMPRHSTIKFSSEDKSIVQKVTVHQKTRELDSKEDPIIPEDKLSVTNDLDLFVDMSLRMEDIRLQYLKLTSEGFTRDYLDGSRSYLTLRKNALDNYYRQMQILMDNQDRYENAIQGLEKKDILTRKSTRGIFSSMTDFITSLWTSGKEMRNNTLTIASNLSERDRSTLYNQLSDHLKGDAANEKEFWEKLYEGDLDSKASRIYNEFFYNTDTEFCDIAQDKNMTTGELTFAKGAELVEKGSKVITDATSTVGGGTLAKGMTAISVVENLQQLKKAKSKAEKVKIIDELTESALQGNAAKIYEAVKSADIIHKALKDDDRTPIPNGKTGVVHTVSKGKEGEEKIIIAERTDNNAPEGSPTLRVSLGGKCEKGTHSQTTVLPKGKWVLTQIDKNGNKHKVEAKVEADKKIIVKPEEGSSEEDDGSTDENKPNKEGWPFELKNIDYVFVQIDVKASTYSEYYATEEDPTTQLLVPYGDPIIRNTTEDNVYGVEFKGKDIKKEEHLTTIVLSCKGLIKEGGGTTENTVRLEFKKETSELVSLEIHGKQTTHSSFSYIKDVTNHSRSVGDVKATLSNCPIYPIPSTQMKFKDFEPPHLSGYGYGYKLTDQENPHYTFYNSLTDKMNGYSTLILYTTNCEELQDVKIIIQDSKAK